MARRLTIPLLMALATLAACQAATTEPPPIEPAAPPPASGSARLDPSVIITPPGPKVPAQYAAFSGVWTGTWDGPLDARLAVREIAPNGRVTVTYAWGELGEMKPGIVDGQGKIAGTTMKLERFASGIDASFAMQSDGTLAGTYSVAGGQPFYGVFRKLR